MVNVDSNQWWQERWDDLVTQARELRVKVRKGRIVSRRGRVTGLQVQPGLVTAQVALDSGGATSVRLRQRPIDEPTWDRVVERLSREAGNAAWMLAGRVSESMRTVFIEEGAEILAFDHHDLTYYCTCADDSAVCLHAVAVHFALGEAIAADPFVLIEFRGRSRDELVEAVRSVQPALGEEDAGDGVEEDDEPTEAFGELATCYWEAGVIPHLAFRVQRQEVDDFEELPVVRALGPGPGQVSPDAVAEVLAPLVRMARQRIQQIAEAVAEEAAIGDAPDPTQADTLDQVLIAAAFQHGFLTSTMVSSALGITTADARRYLQWLVQEGRLETSGRARGTRYLPLDSGPVTRPATEESDGAEVESPVGDAADEAPGEGVEVEAGQPPVADVGADGA